MLPNVQADGIRLVGNAAGTGANLVLISRRHRRAERLVQQKTRYVELALNPDFQKEFSSNIPFTHCPPTVKGGPR